MAVCRSCNIWGHVQIRLISQQDEGKTLNLGAMFDQVLVMDAAARERSGVAS
jgi:hypothetical protein